MHDSDLKDQTSSLRSIDNIAYQHLSLRQARVVMNRYSHVLAKDNSLRYGESYTAQIFSLLIETA